MYRKLKRTWSNNYMENIPRFRKVFPELSKVDSTEMRDRFIELNLDFYTEVKIPVSFLLRLTLPFAILTMMIMLLLMPITFLVTGVWSYSLGEKNYILNWFRALKIF